MTEQQQGPIAYPDAPPTLPTLPDLDALREPAEVRLRHFKEIRDAAQAEIDAAETYLATLRGGAAKTPRRNGTRKKPYTYSESAYRQVLAAVGNHSHCAIKTVASESGMASGHTAGILRSAAERGHVSVERRGRRLRYRITEAGTEFATRS